MAAAVAEQRFVPDIFKNIDENLLIKFRDFHNENPMVYRAFRAKACEIRDAGRWTSGHWDRCLKSTMITLLSMPGF